MDRCQSQENVDFDHYRNIFEDDDVSTGNFAAIRQFIQNAIWSVKVHDFKTKKFRAFIATIRRQLRLDRKPPKSGYDRHFDVEQRR